MSERATENAIALGNIIGFIVMFGAVVYGLTEAVCPL